MILEYPLENNKEVENRWLKIDDSQAEKKA